jgi:hypothetical protein
VALTLGFCNTCNFQKNLPKVSIHPIGEKSPNFGTYFDYSKYGVMPVMLDVMCRATVYIHTWKSLGKPKLLGSVL